MENIWFVTNNFEHDCKIDVYYGYESSNSKQGKRFLFSMTEEQMISKNPDLNPMVLS